jgi:hypothetical protein
LLAAATYFGLVLMPEMAVEKTPTFGILALVGVVFIGIYDGFWSWNPSFFALLMITVLGLELCEATINTKLFNAITS